MRKIDEIQMLRDTLRECLSIIAGMLPYAPKHVQAKVVKDREQASLILRITSGQLPEGYDLWFPGDGRVFARKNKETFEESFDGEFAARLFCWQHASRRESDGGTETCYL